MRSNAVRPLKATNPILIVLAQSPVRMLLVLGVCALIQPQLGWSATTRFRSFETLLNNSTTTTPSSRYSRYDAPWRNAGLLGKTAPMVTRRQKHAVQAAEGQ